MVLFLLPEYIEYEQDMCLAGSALAHELTHAVERLELGIIEVSKKHMTPWLFIEWAVNDFWKPAMKAFPDANFYALFGNHEDRFHRHMSTVDFSKLKGAIKSPTEALKLVERGFEVYENWVEDEVTIGDLTIIHGEFCTTFPTKKHLDVYKKNMLFAHTHRSQMYREGEHVAFNIGSMADFNSPAFNYATKSMKKQWSNGFAIATVVNGITSVEQITWNKNHFVYGGTVWKV